MGGSLKNLNWAKPLPFHVSWCQSLPHRPRSSQHISPTVRSLSNKHQRDGGSPEKVHAKYPTAVLEFFPNRGSACCERSRTPRLASTKDNRQRLAKGFFSWVRTCASHVSILHRSECTACIARCAWMGLFCSATPVVMVIFKLPPNPTCGSFQYWYHFSSFPFK